jgi:hypothetical protein
VPRHVPPVWLAAACRQADEAASSACSDFF